MPRGRKKTVVLTLDEQLVEIDEKIIQTEAAMKELKARKKELIAKKQNEDVERLWNVVKESGKNIDDIIAMVNESSAE